MTKKEFIIKMLPLVLKLDKRLQVHTFNLVGEEFRHTNSCARCYALQILGIEPDMELSPDNNLQEV